MLARDDFDQQLASHLARRIIKAAQLLALFGS